LAQWKSSDELGIIGEEASEWDHYCKTLVNSGILLTDRLDKLIWTRGDRSGNISAKNVYNALASKLWTHNKSWWHRSLWDWDLAPKIKLFTWLMMEDKILTWDNLQRRGWSGPSICGMCRQESETVLHMMLHCSFTQQVWNQILKVYKLNFSWMGSSLQSCIKDWTRKCPLRPMLPSII
jgi:hypothetical protein